MMNAKATLREIHNLTSQLVELGLGDDMTEARLCQLGNKVEISTPAKNPQVVLKKLNTCKCSINTGAIYPFYFEEFL